LDSQFAPSCFPAGGADSDADSAASGGVLVDTASDDAFMALAIAQAQKAWAVGEVPVGAIVVRQGQVFTVAHNLRESIQDPTAHAECLAIREAARLLGSWRLDDCTVYVTLEPCAMCAGAMVLARIARCVYGCADPKGGFMGSLGDLAAHPRLNHRFPVKAGVLADPCAELLRGFFRERRRSRV